MSYMLLATTTFTEICYFEPYTKTVHKYGTNVCAERCLYICLHFLGSYQSPSKPLNADSKLPWDINFVMFGLHRSLFDCLWIKHKGRYILCIYNSRLSQNNDLRHLRVSAGSLGRSNFRDVETICGIGPDAYCLFSMLHWLNTDILYGLIKKRDTQLSFNTVYTFAASFEATFTDFNKSKRRCGEIGCCIEVNIVCVLEFLISLYVPFFKWKGC